jgi:RNA polymerase sigma-70 factor (ECF subfamily)
MAAYVRGDEAAFREIFSRYAPLLGSLARRRVGNDEVAKDLVQQTFLQLHRARFDFREGARLRPWVVTIALNVVREHLRARRRKPVTALEAEPADRASSPAAGPEVAEETARLRAALAELPDAQREVVELHWFQGLSMSEIARAVGASVGAVKVRAHRAYTVLRTRLEETR